jgi:DNA-binding response OmpR family regulator
MARILLVEDEPDIALGLQKDLTLEGYEVEAVGDGEGALERLAKRSFDLLLLDVMLPGKDGFAVCRELRRSGMQAPIILLTARSHEAEKVMGLELGADDYITKPFSAMELRARVKAALRRGASAEPELVRFGDFEVDFARFELRRDGELIDLTPTEFKLVAVFARNPRSVLSREQLLDQVWGHGTHVTDRVVDTHVGNLRKKMEAGGEGSAPIVSVRGFGYRLDA